jgi:hypothetical protein
MIDTSKLRKTAKSIGIDLMEIKLYDELIENPKIAYSGKEIMDIIERARKKAEKEVL